MSQFKFDGTNLCQDESTIGKFSGNTIYNHHGIMAGTIDGNNIRDSLGHRIGSLNGNNILDCNGCTLGSLDDVKRTIDGPSGVTLAAIWLLLVR